jgi:N-acyl-D-aspartate/D-glutamate deacylase
LVTLKLAAEESLDKVAIAVKRLSSEPAEFFGLDVSDLKVGTQADIAIINPDALSAYDSDSNREIIYRTDFQNEQLVNRSNGVVEHTIIADFDAWIDGGFSPELGKVKMGRPLTYAGRSA